MRGIDVWVDQDTLGTYFVKTLSIRQSMMQLAPSVNWVVDRLIKLLIKRYHLLQAGAVPWETACHTYYFWPKVVVVVKIK